MSQEAGRFTVGRSIAGAHGLGAILLSTLVVGMLCGDVFQWNDALGDHDIRLWQFCLLVIGLFLFATSRIWLPVPALLGMGLLVAHTVVVAVTQGTPTYFTAVQIVLFGAGLATCFSLVHAIGIRRWLNLYLICCTVNAVSVIVEQAAWLAYPAALEGWYTFAHRTQLIGSFVRAHGLLVEPSWTSALVSPAIYLCISWRRYARLGVVLAGLAVSFSTLGYATAVVAAAAALMANADFSLRTMLSPVAAVAVVGCLLITPPAQERLRSLVLARAAIAARDAAQARELEGMNSSVAVLIINGAVAFRALNETHYVGVGFGAFKRAWDRHAPTAVVQALPDRLLDRSIVDGGSLAIRAVAELGLLGILCIAAAFALAWQTLRRGRALLRVPGHQDAVVRPCIDAVMIGCIIAISHLARHGQYFNAYLMTSTAAAYAASRVIAAQYKRATLRSVTAQRMSPVCKRAEEGNALESEPSSMGG